MWIGEFAAIWISSWELKHEVCSQFHNSALKTFTLFFLNIRLMLDLFLFSDQATTHPVTTGIIFSHELTWSDSKQQTAEGSAEKIIKNHVVLFIYFRNCEKSQLKPLSVTISSEFIFHSCRTNLGRSVFKLLFLLMFLYSKSSYFSTDLECISLTPQQLKFYFFFFLKVSLSVACSLSLTIFPSSSGKWNRWPFIRKAACSFRIWAKKTHTWLGIATKNDFSP